MVAPAVVAVTAAYAVVDLDKLWKAKREAGYSANSIRITRTVLRPLRREFGPRMAGR
jgi:hypothetical protein